jgi:citrate lyase subunit beta/citryl-CoA lyase
VPDTPLRARSLLFVPGGRADLISKVPRFAPDVVVLDLEDAIAAADKEDARAVAVSALAEFDPGLGTTVLVRVNPVATPWFAADVAAVADSPASGVVLPKLERRSELDDLFGALARHGRADALVVAGLETGLGVADARALLPGVTACYFGAEDYVADVGGHRTPGGLEVLYARSQVSLAAHLAGVVALDQAVVHLDDDAHFTADADAGAAMGYQGKICIHPRQVELCHEVFTPTDAEVVHARSTLAAGAAGVAVVDGAMIDEVHLRMARAVLGRAGEVP